MSNQRRAQSNSREQSQKPAQTGGAPWRRLLLLCFFCSGLTALIYEVLWTRMITTVIGGAPFAVAMVLTIFMGGIGAGSFLAGKFADRAACPRDLARWYGILELVIGGWALIVPLLILALQPLYGWLYRRLFDHFLLYHTLTFAGCVLTLAVPVLCMGATLPLLCRYQLRDLQNVGRGTGLLYALNTAGAAAGALLAGVWLVPALGVRGTLAAAAALNALIGAAALWVARKEPQALLTAKPVVATPHAPADRRFLAGVLLIFGVSGFCSMAYEVIWTQLLSLIVGPTNYSFTIILVVFIFGLAAGSFVFGRLGDRMKRPETLLVATQLAAALLALVASQFLGGSQMLFAKLLLTHQDNFALQNLMKALVLLGFLILPTLCLGATFPLAGKLCARSLDRVGLTIGFAYAINWAGAVLGSFTAGFILVPLLGKEHSLSLVVAAQVIAALAGAALCSPRSSWPALMRWAGAALAAAVLAGAAFLPRWNHLVLASSKYHRLEDFRPLLQATGWIDAVLRGPRLLARHEANELLYYGEGIGGFTTVCRTRDALGVPELWMANSGKFDASSRGDMNTQVLLAHVPMLSHAGARAVLVIGLASGVTAGEVLHYPVERLDILEINEQAARASEFFKPWNHRVLEHPATRLIIQDARAHLRLARTAYDVVISEPSNPWMAGCAALFTRDFFQLVRDRLNDGGCFAQWLHAYQIDWESVALIGRTFQEVFPNCALLSTHPTLAGSDYLLVGFKDDAGRIAEHALRHASHAQKSPHVILRDPRLLHRLVVSDTCAGTFGEGPLNTDNRPRLEFSAPRQMNLSRAGAGGVIERLLQHRHQSEEARSYLTGDGGSVDAQLDFAEFALSLFEPFPGLFDPARATPEQQARFAQLIGRYCESNQIDLAIIQDRELRNRCLARQLALMQARAGTDETNEVAAFYRAQLHQAAGQTEAALAFYQRTAQLNPFNLRALNEAGILLCQAGRLREGIDHFRRVLALDAQQAETHANLATAHYNSGNALLAELHFKEALRIDPTLREAREGLRFLQGRKRP